MNEEHLERYAWLIVKFGVDLHPGDNLYIRGERIHRELALRIGEAAYDLGARRVHYRFGDPLEVSQLIRRGSLDDLARYHERNQAWFAEGKEGFASWLETDRGARALGELALVGRDSPIARSGLYFEHLHYDENTSSHVALGQGFALALDGGESMSLEGREKLGCNQSGIHTDVMFGSPEVTIVATKSQKGEVVLIDQGHWNRWSAPQSLGHIGG